MPNEPRATLIVEIGTVTTRVTLVDAVDGEARLISAAEVSSTTEPPYDDAAIGILEAAAQISETSGRRLLDETRLLMPQTPERDGVDAVLVITSAAGQMSLVIAAVASDISARSALHATRAIYANIVQTVTLNEAITTTIGHDISWIERQVQRLLGTRADAVLLAGGLEDGADDALIRLAHIVGLTALTARNEVGEQHGEFKVQPVVFAGNSRSRERVIAALADHTRPIIVDNLRPSLDLERLEGARQALTNLYAEETLPKLPGYNGLRRLSRTPIRTAAEVSGLMTRFLAEQYERDTLTVDVGATNTAAFLHSQRRYSPVVLGGVGTGYGVGTVLAECGVAAIMRWLPFAISEQELVHWLLNKLIRPHILPTTREDVLIEQAVAREALALTLVALRDERPGASYDMVVAGGGVLVHAPHPGYAALTLLDALQPGVEESNFAIQLHLDTFGLLGACGALATSDPDAALTLCERDLLQNTPLATCVTVLGNGRVGDIAVEADLQVVGGEVQHISIKHGEIVCIPLAMGQKAQLKLRPRGNARIGRDAAGAAVESPLAALSGSALGVVIDARGRPLRFADEPQQRQAAIWDALVALGAESGPLPYAVAGPLPEPLVPALSEPTDEPMIEPITAPLPGVSVSDAQEPPPLAAVPVEGQGLDNDLARLRQTVEAPPEKKGWLKRK